MLPFPQIDPILASFGPIAIRWYGLMYSLAFLLGWPLLAARAARGKKPVLTPEHLGDFMVWILGGVVLGGRLGYILFYQADYYLAQPMAIFRIWEGGMSFHGGLLGVLVACAWFGRRRGVHFLTLTDMLAPVVPLGLFLGRVGNFINGELWGRTTDLPWAMVFPGAGSEPRHPSQLYEAGLEGVFLFLLLHLLGRRPRPAGFLSGFFLLGYGTGRFFVEFAREPDPHLGYLFLQLTMGQWLTIPMILLGMAIIARALPLPGQPPKCDK